MSHFIYTKKSPSTKRKPSYGPPIIVKRMKNVENSYMVTEGKKPYCIVETSPYKVWDPDHTFSFPISERYEKKILDLIHALENS